MAKNLKRRFKTLSVAQVKPKGWLYNQMKVQMNGLTGKLYDVWDSVGSYSGWLGGTGENWERAPYYLDGLLPLAFYLDDKEHWDLANKFISWTLASQDDEGNFGPAASKSDYWSRFVMLKVLVQYYEITKDEQVLPFFKKYFSYLYKAVQAVPMTQWSRARIADLLYCINWHIEKTGDENSLPLVDLLRAQALNWTDLFDNFPFVRSTAYYYDWKRESTFRGWEEMDSAMKFHSHHIVNVTMGLKYSAMLSYFFDDIDFEKSSSNSIYTLDKYHGVASGAINGDEHLSGNDPSQGAELCSIVEYMFSLQTMMEAFGNPFYADKLERLAYNALPATISEDFMSHQYLQQANQVLVTDAKRNWYNNNSQANMFGLEPNFGCCTANMHQGWPKFLKSLWYVRDDSIYAMTYAPNEVCFDFNGNNICIEEETDYPFKTEITFRVKEGDCDDVKFFLRIPGWCKSYIIKKNGDVISQTEKLSEDAEFIEVCMGLKKGDVFEFIPTMNVTVTHWFHNSIAVERGPFVYALDMKEKWVAVKEAGGVKDYEIYPESPWNYALDKNTKFEYVSNDVSDVPFSKVNAPCVLNCNGRKLASWQMEKNSAGVLPISPVSVEAPDENIRLIPYGCTKLRITQFPFFKK